MSLDPADEAVNLLYMPTLTVPDAAATIAGWSSSSGAIRAQLRPGERAYGDGLRERIDIFEPPVAAPKATVLFIHGGYWRALYKEDVAYLAPSLLALDLRVAIMSYDLLPTVTLATIAGQARAATAALADWYPQQPLIVSGHSAGGHLTAIVHATDWAAHGLPTPAISGAIALSGLFDLTPLLRTELKPLLALDHDQARALSPAYMSPTAAAPLLLAVGERESTAFHRQSALLYDAWPQVANAPQTLSGHDHFTAPDALAPLIAELIASLL